jgi:hypothetical protein
MTTCPGKITFGELRESGVRDVRIYCCDHRCSHHVETTGLKTWLIGSSGGSFSDRGLTD